MEELQQLPQKKLYNLDNFEKLSTRVFEVKKGTIYIGGEEIRPDVLVVLKEQARYLSTSQFYDILKSTIINESSELALKQSTKWEDVEFAKALYHIQYVLNNMITQLTK